MHILHLIVVRAEDALEACSTVEKELEGWGTESNWSVVCGCVSEDNQVYIHNRDGRFLPNKDETIGRINKMVGGWLKDRAACYEAQASGLMRKALNNTAKTFDWLALKKFCDFKYQTSYIDDPEKLNVLTQTFFDGHYDENGVTNLSLSKVGRQFIVFLDMHT